MAYFAGRNEKEIVINPYETDLSGVSIEYLENQSAA